MKLDEKYLDKAREIILKNNFLVKVALVEKNGLKKNITELEIGGESSAE